MPLWPEGRVSVRQLIDYFATYMYLPRLAGPEVLLGAIRGGLALLTWTSIADQGEVLNRRHRLVLVVLAP